MPPIEPKTAKRLDGEAALRMIDAAVSEIFQAMLFRQCWVTGEATGIGVEISGSIRFSGSLEGECIVELSRSAAQQIADLLLGSEESRDDAMIDDTVGELCNMIAGGWKSKLDDLPSTCQLSPPAVARGSSRHATRPMPGRLYSFSGGSFQVGLAVDLPVVDRSE